MKWDELADVFIVVIFTLGLLIFLSSIGEQNREVGECVFYLWLIFSFSVVLVLVFKQSN